MLQKCIWTKKEKNHIHAYIHTTYIHTYIHRSELGVAKMNLDKERKEVIFLEGRLRAERDRADDLLKVMYVCMYVFIYVCMYVCVYV